MNILTKSRAFASCLWRLLRAMKTKRQLTQRRRRQRRERCYLYVCVDVCTNRTAERCVVERPREEEKEKKRCGMFRSLTDDWRCRRHRRFSLLSPSLYLCRDSRCRAFVLLLSFLFVNRQQHAENEREREKVGNDSTYAHSVYFSHFVLKYTITRLEEKTPRSSNYSCIT